MPDHPATGQMFYCPQENSLYLYDGTEWKNLVAERFVQSKHVLHIESDKLSDKEDDFKQLTKSVASLSDSLLSLIEVQKSFSGDLKAISLEIDHLERRAQAERAQVLGELQKRKEEVPFVWSDAVEEEAPHQLILKVILGIVVSIFILNLLRFFAF